MQPFGIIEMARYRRTGCTEIPTNRQVFMRLRNVRGSRETIAADECVLHDPEDQKAQKGHWHELATTIRSTSKSAWVKVSLS